MWRIEANCSGPVVALSGIETIVGVEVKHKKSGQIGMKTRGNKAALIVAGIYFSLVCLSFVITVATLDATPMAGIFLVLFTFPWPGFLTRLMDPEQSPVLVRALFLLAGGLINGVLLYTVISWLQQSLRK